MRLAIPRETHPGENRASVTPETVKKLVRLGADLAIESGTGAGAGFSDEAYAAEGASVVTDRDALLGAFAQARSRGSGQAQARLYSRILFRPF